MKHDQHFWNNEHLQREHAAILEKWKESELVLDCLRTKKGQEIKEYSEEEIVEWNRQIK